ncbi:MAG: hypothetical protein AVDCRST_MAG56-1711, partial [uncultured Cytophagales bacterium]
APHRVTGPAAFRARLDVLLHRPDQPPQGTGGGGVAAAELPLGHGAIPLPALQLRPGPRRNHPQPGPLLLPARRHAQRPPAVRDPARVGRPGHPDGGLAAARRDGVPGRAARTGAGLVQVGPPGQSRQRRRPLQLRTAERTGRRHRSGRHAPARHSAGAPSPAARRPPAGRRRPRRTRRAGRHRRRQASSLRRGRPEPRTRRNAPQSHPEPGKRIPAPAPGRHHQTHPQPLQRPGLV